MRFCGSCGESLPQQGADVRDRTPIAPAASLAPPPTHAQAPEAEVAPAAHAAGPVGETREPVIVLLLAVVTLGLYGLYYWWIASREVDEHTQRPGNSHNLVRIGTIVSVAAGIVLVFAVISFLGSLFADLVAGRQPTDQEIASMVLGGIGIFLLAATAAFVGSVLRLVGKWRMWSALEAHERARMHPNPLSAGLMVGLVIGSWFIPFVGWILPLVVMYLTQEHLNQAWEAAGAPLRA